MNEPTDLLTDENKKDWSRRHVDPMEAFRWKAEIRVIPTTSGHGERIYPDGTRENFGPQD